MLAAEPRNEERDWKEQQANPGPEIGFDFSCGRVIDTTFSAVNAASEEKLRGNVNPDAGSHCRQNRLLASRFVPEERAV